ncbi:MAG: PEP-CTERM sorting domain-containing protein [Planctomycetota bacterium]
MKRTLFGFTAAAMLAGTASAVTINEIRIDQGGSDNSEYFELAGAASESLDNVWYVVLGDTGGGTDGSNGFGDSGIVEAAVDLTGETIGSNGLFLAVESSFENGVGETFEGVVADLVGSFSFENSDNVTHLLVTNFTGSVGDDLDTDEDGTLNTTPWSSVIDAIGLAETTTPAASGDDILYGSTLGGTDIGPDGTFVPAHVYRFPDGSGDWNIGAFAIEDDTPGSLNVPEPGSLALLGLGGLLIARRRRG